MAVLVSFLVNTYFNFEGIAATFMLPTKQTAEANVLKTYSMTVRSVLKFWLVSVILNPYT